MSSVIKENSPRRWKNDIHKLDLRDILPADQHKAFITAQEIKTQADDILGNAKLMAETIILEARKKADQLSSGAQQAYDHKKTEGYEKGYAEGMELASSEQEKKYSQIIAEQVAELRGIGSAFQEAYAQTLKNSEKFLVRLAFDIAAKIVKDKCAVDESIVVNNVKDALSRVVEKSGITVRVNPAQLSALKSGKESILSTLDDIKDFEIVHDDKVQPGGCVVETPTGSVEARMQMQLDQMKEALTGQHPEESDVPD